MGGFTDFSEHIREHMFGRNWLGTLMLHHFSAVKRTGVRVTGRFRDFLCNLHKNFFDFCLFLSLTKLEIRRRVTMVAPIILAHFPHFVNTFLGKKIKKFFSKFRLIKYVEYDIMESLGAPKESAPPFYHFQIDLSSTFFKKKCKIKNFFICKIKFYSKMHKK